MTLGNVAVGFLAAITLIVVWALAQGIGESFGAIAERLVP